MSTISLTDLAKIIERDSKDATYKFALLRGTIDLIQEYGHYKTASGTEITFPMGLLILKWIDYYYPILSHPDFIPQKHGDSKERTISFRSEFERVIELYPNSRESYQLFYDLKKGIQGSEKIKCIRELVIKIRNTIVKQPMHYIGSAIDQGGKIYRYNNDSKSYKRNESLNLEWIIDHMGTFSIPIDMHHVMKVVGSFMTGTHSLIFRWAEFTSSISGEHQISTSDMISLLKSDFNERDILLARNYYINILENDSLYCVWSGKNLRSNIHIDHMIPFVALRNNDLWNLMPSRADVNIRKSDKIPSRALLNNTDVKERILIYWDKLYEEYPVQFTSEIQISLLGNTRFTEKSWKNESYKQLVGLSMHMIEERGFAPWSNKVQ